MATERMIHFPFGQSRAQNCSKMGSMMYGWSAGTETLLRDSGSVENSPMIEYTVPVYMLMRSLLAQALSRFIFPTLPVIAGCCVRVRVKLGSRRVRRCRHYNFAMSVTR
jgi:hypothetical protein